jgi:hypothetical protein
LVSLLAGAAAGAYLLLHRSFALAAAFCALPLVLWLLGQLTLSFALLGASIPYASSLTGGGGFNIAASDLLLVLVAGALFLQAATTGSLPGVAALRPLKAPVLQYSIFMGLILLAHIGVSDFLKTGQRFELFLVPLVAGAFAAVTGRYLVLLKAYIVSAAILAVAWPLVQSLGLKNPVGLMIANALLLLVGVRGLRRYTRLALLLVPGLLLTGSRGAVLATLVGLVVLVMFQSSRMRAIVPRVLVVLAAGTVVFALLPTALQSRFLTLTPGTQTKGAYSLTIRQEFSAAAKTVIHAHPWVGVGVGNYRPPNAPPGSPPQDPHNVLLLQAAEGGYGLAVSFVVLIAGVALALFGLRTAELAPTAAAVLLASVAHGFVDVYWVRATPVLGWILVGMACGLGARKRLAVAEVAG